jgi:hypothetical protein
MYYKGRRNGDKAQLAKAKAKHELSGSTRTLFVGTAGVAGELDVGSSRITTSRADPPTFCSTFLAVLMYVLCCSTAPTTD